MGKWGVLCHWWDVYLHLKFSLALDVEITSVSPLLAIIFGIGYYSLLGGSVVGFSGNYANF